MTRIADLLEYDPSKPIEGLSQPAHPSPAELREAVVHHVLRKKPSQEAVLRNLYRECAAPLMRNIRLEDSSRPTDLDEDRFVRFYPYLPHVLDLWLDVIAGIRRHPGVRGDLPADGGLVRQVTGMCASQVAAIAEKPVGLLVSLDRMYPLVEPNISTKKQLDVEDIGERFEWDEDYPRMAARVARALCLMEFVETGLPRTTANIAALLIQQVTDPPPVLAVAALLYYFNQAGLVRETSGGWRLSDFDELRRIAVELETLRKAVGAVNPRPPDWHNRPIQAAKKTLARMLAWYTRSVQQFDASVARSIEELVSSLDRLSMNMADHYSRQAAAIDQLSLNVAALEGRMALLDKRRPGLHSGNCRTTYILGLFGTGRRYINQWLLDNLGERTRYFRDTIRIHPGPTPMIYSGHATLKYVSRMQEPPAVMCAILDAVRARFADSIFIYRHPLDSLLTNWVWWRAHLHHNRAISGISEIYPAITMLCAELERNFGDFQMLADGNPEFFAAAPGERFLSFAEYVEETDLHIDASPLSLRFEDFMDHPQREFSRIAAAMSIPIDPNALPAPPKSRRYGYLAVREQVPRFQEFIANLDSVTKERIQKIGYSL